MRKIIKSLILAVSFIGLFFFYFPQKTFSQTCCNVKADCNPGETCTGPLNYACQQAGFTKTCEVGTTLSCGSRCDPNNDQCPADCPCSYVAGSWLCHTTPPEPKPPEPKPPVPGVECIPTAIGCIDVKGPSQFVNTILNLAIGLAGGIAMLLIIFGGIQILTSAGNPEKIQAGKELITSAIAGLILIVFSVFILRIIGVEILDIF